MDLKLNARVLIIGFVPGIIFMIGIIGARYEWNFSEIYEHIKNITYVSGFALLIVAFLISQFFDGIRNGAIENYWSWKIKNRVKNINLFLEMQLLTWFTINKIFKNNNNKKLEKFLNKKLGKIKLNKNQNIEIENNELDIDWHYFERKKGEAMNTFDNNYYIWYMLDINMIICYLFLFLCMVIFYVFYDLIPNFYHLTISYQIFNNVGIILFMFLSGCFFYIDYKDLRDEIVKITNKSNDNKESNKN